MLYSSAGCMCLWILKTHEYIGQVNVAEDVAEGYRLTNFSARDVDNNGNSKIVYAIDQESDRKQQFSIDEQGIVSVQVRD